MANDIINTLIEERIDVFRFAFSISAKALFRDDDKLNKIRHPGEFGVYREAIVRDFLQSFLPQKLAIDTGFVVNALGETSKQIDLVVYDPSFTPYLESKNRQRFFPVETVIAVGEVRSDVNRAQFEDALIRISEVKKMRANLPKEAGVVKKWYGLGDHEYDPDKIPFDQVFTFLLCNRINFPLRETFPSQLNEIYKSVKYTHRHNAVLSLEDGLVHYVGEFPPGEFADCSFPTLPGGNQPNRNKWIHSYDDTYIPLKMFCSDLFMHALHCTIGHCNLIEYAKSDSRHQFLEEGPKSDE